MRARILIILQYKLLMEFLFAYKFKSEIDYLIFVGDSHRLRIQMNIKRKSSNHSS